MTGQKIARIDVVAWEVPMRAAYRSAQRITTIAHNVLVTVTLESGVVGYGESAPATYVTGETQASVQASASQAAFALIGHTVEEALALLSRDTNLHDAPGASGALEIALWDAGARAAGVPLYRSLGGAAEVIPTRATDLSLPILPPDEATTRTAAAYAQGFRAFKIKVGAGDMDADVARVRAIADAAPTATLRLDGNQGFAPAEALALLERLSDLIPRIDLFEQPTKAGDDIALRFVQERISPLPVFADESAHTPDDARRLIETGACRGVVLKLAKSGLSGARAIAEATGAVGGTCLFGCMMETHIATGAALHLAVALGVDTVPLLDLDGHLLVRDDELLEGGFTQQGDLLQIDPTQAGLGLKLRTVC